MKNKLTKKQFLHEVREEIEHLKKNATPAEINKLSKSRLDPQDPRCCIYGQMTGRCSSQRALDLNPKKYGEVADPETYSTKGIDTFTDVKQQTDFFVYPHFTPLEVYITLKDARPTNVVDYLKGVKTELKL